MFSLYNNWNLFAILKLEGDRSRVFIVGYDGTPDERRRKDPNYFIQNGCVILELQRPEDKQALIDSGLDSKTPLLIKGFMATAIGKKPEKSTRTFNFTDANSFVQAEGGFENQYCMCESCFHPVSTVTRVEVSQADLDSLNIGKTIEVGTGEVSYQCTNCGSRSTKQYKNLKIWKTITGPSLDFDDRKITKDNKSGKIDGPIWDIHGFAERVVDEAAVRERIAEYERAQGEPGVADGGADVVVGNPFDVFIEDEGDRPFGDQQ